MNSFNRFICALTFSLLACFPAFTDVVFLKSGEVVLGTLVSASSGSVVIRSLGLERSIDASLIDRSEEGLNVLEDINLEILLKDGTIIRGTIVDYDEEIGVFVDISFGNLALPVGTIQVIQDPKHTKAASEGSSFGLSGLAGLPLSKNFGLSGGMAASADFKSAFLPRLYLGADVSWSPLNYTGTDEVGYTLAGFSLHALYKFEGLGERSRFFRLFVPYAKLGVGAVVVQVSDDREEAPVEDQGIMTGLLVGQIGLEWKLPSIFRLRLFLDADMAFQSGGVFVLPGAGLGLYLSL